jgi:hypothetical protein
MQTLKQVLRPDWRKFLLFAIFVVIAIGGNIQAWVFTDVPPKPPLYDLLRPFPIWPIWMYLLIPLALLVLPLRLLNIDVMGGPFWLFIVANITYFYLLSCLIVAGSRWIKAKWKSRRKVAK